MNPFSISHLPQEERPRERLEKEGAASLSIVELIAILLGSGRKEKPVLQLSHEIVSKFEDLQVLAEATLSELLEIKGIGKAKAIQLQAAIQLGKRLSRAEIVEKRRINTAFDVYSLLRDELEYEKREIFIAIFQDTKGCVICHEVISIGNLSQTLVHPREVFYPAIRHKAASMIIVHNHPSGDPTPSPQDIEITNRLIQSSKVISIPILDHIIIGHQKYISLKEKGLSFSVT